MEHSSNIQRLLAKNLREARLERNLSQQQLADLVEISVLSISNIERCTSWPRPQTLDKIAAKLHLSPYELFLNKQKDEVAPKATLAKTVNTFIQQMTEMSVDLQGPHSGHPKVTYHIKHPIKSKKK